MTAPPGGLYEARFDQVEVSQKDAVWRVIVGYLARYIDRDAPVLDLACDRGHFIRWVDAPDRWATDIRDVSASLPAEVRFVQASGLALRDHLPVGSFGTVFMSNYLEHLQDAAQVLEQLRVAGDLLRPGGRVIILQPNIRLIGPRYWDFLDHAVPITEARLLEAAELADLRTEHLVTRFLPYSTKGRLPTHPALVRAYLAIPLAWRLLGRQTLYVGSRPRP